MFFYGGDTIAPSEGPIPYLLPTLRTAPPLSPRAYKILSYCLGTARRESLPVFEMVVKMTIKTEIANK